MPAARKREQPKGSDARQAAAAAAASPTSSRASGLTRDADLVLHLPLRYEDHTRLVPLAALAAGLAVQTEGIVVNTDIQYRPRRQLVCLIADPEQRDAQLVLRFFTFYPSQQKALQPGQRVRVFGDVRPGYFGLEIVHPQWKVVAEGAPLPIASRRCIRRPRAWARRRCASSSRARSSADPALLGGDAARTSSSRAASSGSSATRCASCTRRRRVCPS